MVFELNEWIMIFVAVLIVCVSIILSGRWISRSIETLALEAPSAPMDKEAAQALAEIEAVKKAHPSVKFEDMKPVQQ